MSDVLRQIKKEKIIIVMGDFNAKVGKSKDGKVVGQFGLGDGNERRQRPREFVEEQQYVMLHTFFKLPPRRGQKSDRLYKKIKKLLENRYLERIL